MTRLIAPGTVLQERYCLKRILGRGGFGRTYLAEDRTRFNELCVLKEYVPGQGEEAVLQKAKELFEREAQVLYKIRHPQIPQFRATFTEAGRIFLVQDFIEGKSYSTLLKARMAQKRVFAETEILQFLMQMLPVLKYIHEQGLIHRDISPDNIICRMRDRLPVLIDFGVVKQIGSHWQGGLNGDKATRVGKIGYSPSEQLQAGKVSPSSDLYALGVTAVVLMTGREPQELFDASSMTWRWHQWVPTLSPWFAPILNRMMSLKPNTRYQSATEIIQALRSVSQLIDQNAQSLGEETAIQRETLPSLNSLTEIGLARIPEPPPTLIKANSTKPGALSPSPIASLKPKTSTSEFQSLKHYLPLIGLGGGAIVVLLAGGMVLGSMMQSLQGRQQRKALYEESEGISLPSPRRSQSTPGNASTDAAINILEEEKRLDLSPGESIIEEGQLLPNQTVVYTLEMQSEQNLDIQISGLGVALSLRTPEGDTLADQAQQWQGTTPISGEYRLELVALNPETASTYQLSIQLSPQNSARSKQSSEQNSESEESAPPTIDESEGPSQESSPKESETPESNPETKVRVIHRPPR